MTRLVATQAQSEELGSFLAAGAERFAFAFLTRGPEEFSAYGSMHTWTVNSFRLLEDDEDYDGRDDFHLVVADHVRRQALRHAHANSLALGEAHWHGGAQPARLSGTAVSNLSDVTPQLLWRLPGRPYISLVFADTSFDALVFDKTGVSTLTEFTIGGNGSRPTGLSAQRFQPAGTVT